MYVLVRQWSTQGSFWLHLGVKKSLCPFSQAYTLSNTEFTGGILKKRIKNTEKVQTEPLCDQTKQDRKQIFEGILFFKATNNT